MNSLKLSEYINKHGDITVGELAELIACEKHKVTTFNSIVGTNRFYSVDLATILDPEDDNIVLGHFATFMDNTQFDKLSDHTLGEFVFPNEVEAKYFAKFYFNTLQGDIQYFRPQPVYLRKITDEVLYTLSSKGDVVPVDEPSFDTIHNYLRMMYCGLLFSNIESVLKYKEWLTHLKIPYKEILDESANILK